MLVFGCALGISPIHTPNSRPSETWAEFKEKWLGLKMDLQRELGMILQNPAMDERLLGSVSLLGRVATMTTRLLLDVGEKFDACWQQVEDRSVFLLNQTKEGYSKLSDPVGLLSKMSFLRNLTDKEWETLEEKKSRPERSGFKKFASMFHWAARKVYSRDSVKSSSPV